MFLVCGSGVAQFVDLLQQGIVHLFVQPNTMRTSASKNEMLTVIAGDVGHIDLDYADWLVSFNLMLADTGSWTIVSALLAFEV